MTNLFKLIKLSLLIGSLAGCGVVDQAKGLFDSEEDKKKNKSGAGLTGGKLNSVCYDKYALQLTGASQDALDHLQATPEWITPQVIAVEGNGQRTVSTARYYFGELPLCRHSAKIQVIRDRAFVKNEPDFSSVNEPSLTYFPAGLALDHIALEHDTTLDQVDYGRLDKCFILANGGTVAAFEIDATISGKPWAFTVTADEIVWQQSMALHGSASAKVYDGNPYEGTRDYEFDSIEGDKPETDRFRIMVPEPFELAKAVDSFFDYEENDPEFAQLTALAHAEDMADWLSKDEHEFSMECLPLEVKMHQIVQTPYGDTKNNAQYNPPNFSRNSLPSIQLGDGDGRGLQNLAYDFDVVAHELAHHVVFSKMKSKDGDTLAIHEGIADALLYMMTQNACLGESICPEGSRDCYLPGRCLRTADNTLKIEDENLTYPYGQAMVISGFVWDMSKVFGFDETGELTMRAINYFADSMSYEDMVEAFMKADVEMTEGDNACEIGDIASNRGFDIDEDDCKEFEP